MLLNVFGCLLLTAVTVHSYNNHHCCRMFNFPSTCHFRQSFYQGATRSPNYDPPGPSGNWKRYVRWHKPLTNAAGTHACRQQGVLKINPGHGVYQAEKVHVYLGICNPYKFSFNVGDQVTNNAYGGGDPGTDDYCAEIHNYNTRMYVYENVKWKRISGPPATLNYLPNYFNSLGSTTWHLELDRCNRLRMSTNPNIKGTDFFMRDDQMFRYDDFYLGINRVVNTNWPSPGRTGAGVCEVCIRFEDTTYRPPSCYGAGYGYCRPTYNPFLRSPLTSSAREGSPGVAAAKPDANSESKISGTLDNARDAGDPSKA